MKIWHSNYQLYPKGSIQQRGKAKYRQGALLRIEFEPGLIGYSDLCPHSSFGDQPLEIELQNIKREAFSTLADRSLLFARMDAEARAEGKSLYGPERIANHYLIGDIMEFDLSNIPILQGQRFDTFKIKLGDELMLETEMLKSFCGSLSKGSKVRLDFNCKLGQALFVNWMERNGDWLKPQLDFVEDPFQYDPTEWIKVSEQFGIDLAVDFAGPHYDKLASGAQVIVIKPALQDELKLVEGLGGNRAQICIYSLFRFSNWTNVCLCDGTKIFSQWKSHSECLWAATQ